MLLNGRKLFTIMAVCKQNYVYDALSRLIFDSIPGDPIDARSAAPGWASHLRHCLNCSFNKHLTIKRCTLNTSHQPPTTFVYKKKPHSDLFLHTDLQQRVKANNCT